MRKQAVTHYVRLHLQSPPVPGSQPGQVEQLYMLVLPSVSLRLPTTPNSFAIDNTFSDPRSKRSAYPNTYRDPASLSKTLYPHKLCDTIEEHFDLPLIISHDFTYLLVGY